MKDKTPMSREEETLKSIARQANPSPSFTNELEKKLMNAHKPEKTGFFSFGQIASTAGWAIGLAALTLAFIWVIRSIAPQPKPQPAAGDTPAPQETRAAPTPSGAAYKRYGQTLYLQAELPASPTEASVYNYLPEQPATLESARALAAQFGMEGAVYKFPSETASLAKDFLVVDGERHLHVRSDQYFQYYYYPRYAAAVNSQTPPVNAEAVIEDFLQSHGFDFPHRIQPSEIYGGYVAVPLTPDGHILCYEYFKCAGLHFQFDEQGVIYYIDGILPKYELIGQYGIISAEEALKLYIDPALTGNPNATMGSIEGMHSPTPTFQTWLRARPLDQTLTLYGYLNSVPSAEGGAPLVTFDGYTATGNTADIPAEY
ncbi:MAG: hypothetical protein LDL51_10260, partial [Chloroflexi bacterium]|nr:hypothetical protein [Chloroflexota bacterium]